MFLEDFKGLSLVTFYHSLQVLSVTHIQCYVKSILKSVNNNEIQILIKSAIELTKMIWFGALVPVSTPSLVSLPGICIC